MVFIRLPPQRVYANSFHEGRKPDKWLPVLVGLSNVLIESQRDNATPMAGPHPEIRMKAGQDREKFVALRMRSEHQKF
jgi:hypothetical protein